MYALIDLEESYMQVGTLPKASLRIPHPSPWVANAAQPCLPIKTFRPDKSLYCATNNYTSSVHILACWDSRPVQTTQLYTCYTIHVPTWL